MADRKASAIWEGTVKEGKGIMHFAGYDGPFTYASRFEEGEGTNPEELIGAAHAGCYSMALSSGLTKAGFPPEKIETTAHMALRNIDGKTTITKSHLVSKARVPGITLKNSWNCRRPNLLPGFGPWRCGNFVEAELVS